MRSFDSPACAARPLGLPALARDGESEAFRGRRDSDSRLPGSPRLYRSRTAASPADRMRPTPL
jgi:hypothetical protein